MDCRRSSARAPVSRVYRSVKLLHQQRFPARRHRASFAAEPVVAQRQARQQTLTQKGVAFVDSPTQEETGGSDQEFHEERARKRRKSGKERWTKPESQRTLTQIGFFNPDSFSDDNDERTVDIIPDIKEEDALAADNGEPSVVTGAIMSPVVKTSLSRYGDIPKLKVADSEDEDSDVYNLYSEHEEDSARHALKTKAKFDWEIPSSQSPPGSPVFSADESPTSQSTREPLREIPPNVVAALNRSPGAKSLSGRNPHKQPPHATQPTPSSSSAGDATTPRRRPLRRNIAHVDINDNDDHDDDDNDDDDQENIEPLFTPDRVRTDSSGLFKIPTSSPRKSSPRTSPFAPPPRNPFHDAALCVPSSQATTVDLTQPALVAAGRETRTADCGTIRLPSSPLLPWDSLDSEDESWRRDGAPMADTLQNTDDIVTASQMMTDSMAEEQGHG